MMAVMAYAVLAPRLPLLIPTLFWDSMNGIALGLIISCIERAPQEASNVPTTVAIVLQFFPGMCFLIDYLPTYLQQIGRFIPMNYAAQALRDVVIRNVTLTGPFLPLMTLAGSALALYSVGVVLYRKWVEK